MATPIEYCLTNVSRATRERLRACPATTREHRCLQRCGRCRTAPFLVVDGAVETGDDHDDLLDSLEVTES
jgi:uncharacterized protein YuzB (UPF0349 family)